MDKLKESGGFGGSIAMGGVIIGYTRSSCGNGLRCYKNMWTFANRPEEICYIPEWTDDDFDKADAVMKSFENAKKCGYISAAKAQKRGYTFNDILKTAKGDEVVARCIMEFLSGQTPENILRYLTEGGDIDKETCKIIDPLVFSLYSGALEIERAYEIAKKKCHNGEYREVKVDLGN